MPTIAIGSSLAWALTAMLPRRSAPPSPPPAGARPGRRRSGSRRRASAAGAARSAAPSRLRSSTAASESKPRSLKAGRDRSLRPRRGRAPRRPRRGPDRARSRSRSGSGRAGERLPASEPEAAARAAGTLDEAAKIGGRSAGRGHARAGRRGLSGPRSTSGSLEAERGVEESQALLRRRAPRTPPRSHPLPGRPRRARAVMPLSLCPGPPGERGGRQALGAALLGERVEEGVGGGVVGLAGRAEGAGGRGEEDEGREVAPCGQLVQVPGGVGLGGEDAIQALGVERLDRGRRRGRRRSGTTAPSGCSAGIEASSSASCSRSATSQAAIVTSAPELLQARPRAPRPPRPALPLRLTSSRWRAPWCSARWRATRAPRPPVPPVISTVRSGSIG